MGKAKTAVIRSARRKGRSTTHVRARPGWVPTVETDDAGATKVTMRTKSGLITVVRSRRTGRFTAAGSAKVIDRGAERFADTLKRLATK